MALHVGQAEAIDLTPANSKVGTHSTRKTLARKVYTWSNDIRVVQRILGHRSLASTDAYVKSLTDRAVWTAFRTAAA